MIKISRHTKRSKYWHISFPHVFMKLVNFDIPFLYSSFFISFLISSLLLLLFSLSATWSRVLEIISIASLRSLELHSHSNFSRCSANVQGPPRTSYLRWIFRSYYNWYGKVAHKEHPIFTGKYTFPDP